MVDYRSSHGASSLPPRAVSSKLSELLNRNRPQPPKFDRNQLNDSEAILKYCLQISDYILRQDQMKRQQEMSEAIGRCMAIIEKEKKSQLKDFDQLLQETYQVISKINELKVKYNRIQSTQQIISGRVDRLQTTVKLIQPPLSIEEERMKSKLLKTQADMTHLQNSLREMKSRLEYLEAVKNSSETLVEENVETDSNPQLDIDKIILVLQKQLTTAADLSNRVNDFKATINEQTKT